MKRMHSRKSHSWWWNSHISPKNSKWLEENLAEMDRLIKEMLKLIEEEGDSFAKKAEMYYKRRPELISHVEDVYRMYRALAERYNHVTGELRKTIPSELHTQGSGSGSDLSSEPPSPSPERTPELKATPPKLSQRAAGFNIFVVSSGNSDLSKKDSDGSSSSESDSGSDGFGEVSVEDLSNGLHQRILELENELCDVKEKLREYEKGSNGRCEHLEDGDTIDLNSKVTALEEELRSANENLFAKEAEILTADIELGVEKKLVSELQERIAGLESEVLDCKQETNDLKASMATTNKQYESDVLSRDEAIAEYKRELEGVSGRYLREKFRLESDAANLEGAIQDLKAEVNTISDYKSELEAKVLEQEHVIQELESTAARFADRFFLEKSGLEAKVLGLSQSHASLEVKLRALEDDIRRLEAEKAELNQDLEGLNLKSELVSSEKEELSVKFSALTEEVKNKDVRICQMGEHLHQLHLEHAKLIVEIEETRRAGTELRERAKELEDEVERQRIMISDGAEGKREAIRQLCFSLEHYRDGYRQLRQVLQGHKRPVVMAI